MTFISTLPSRRVTRATTAKRANEVENGSSAVKHKPKLVRKLTARRRSHVKYITTVSSHRTPPIHAQRFQIIQETVSGNLYKLLVAASLWNRTAGAQAKPIFRILIEKCPTVDHLSNMLGSDLANILRPLGLQNIRARRLISFANAWIMRPPAKTRRYRRLHYPYPDCGRDVRSGEVLEEDDPREGWEISHLPGIGPYALDSFRIFHRDILRGLATDWNGASASPGFEPEWKRTCPLDKELKAFVRWMWLKEGWIWDPRTAQRVPATETKMELERQRKRSASPELL